MSAPPTILFQPFATEWLGHVSRLIAIAQAIRRKRPDVRLAFAPEGNAAPLLEATGFPCFTLPPRADTRQPEWGAWSPDERKDLFDGIGESLLNHLQPRVVVFDSVPYPHLIDPVRRTKIAVAWVARRTRHEERSFEIVRSHVSMLDLVIVPHTPEEIPIPPDLAGKAHHVGTIVRDLPAPARPASPSTGSRFIVVTGGGGGFAGTVDYYNLALAALRIAAAQSPPFTATLVTGPMFRQWDQLRPVEGVTIRPFDPDFGSTLARADLVICQAGYNTLAEVTRLGKPAVCLPAPRVADDQYARANRVAARGRNLLVFTGSSVGLLAAQIIRGLTLRPTPVPVSAPHFSGADRAADLILSLCD